MQAGASLADQGARPKHKWCVPALGQSPIAIGDSAQAGKGTFSQNSKICIKNTRLSKSSLFPTPTSTLQLRVLKISLKREENWEAVPQAW